jgi:CBS domain-containing protein
MVTPVTTVMPETTYEDAAFLLNENHLSGLPVVDAENKVVGVISEKDLFRALYPLYEDYVLEPHAYCNQEQREDEIESIRKQPIKDLMSRKVISVSPDDPVLHAGGLMLAHNIHRLPVIKDGKLVGIVTREDIYGTILRKHLQG